MLFGVCGYLAYAGISRLPTRSSIEAGPMIAFAAIGLLANGTSLMILNRSDTGSLNMRAAVAEVGADLLGSVFAVAAGIVIVTTGYERADAIASLAIAALILPRAALLLRDAAVVLLEIAPEHLDVDAVEHHLRHVDGVLDVHDLHAWTITSGMASLSAHVTVTDEALAARGVGAILDELCACVTDHFEVRHATFQVEPASHGAHEDLGEVH